MMARNSQNSTFVFQKSSLSLHLSTLVMVGFNQNAFKPQIAAIKDKYYEMFRNKTKS